MTTLLIEPFGGLAGDMFLAALLDLEDARFGLDDLRELAERLVPGEAELRCETTRRGSIQARLLSVVTPESAHPPHRHLDALERLLEDVDLSPGVRRRARAILVRIAEAEGRVHGVSPAEIHFHEVGAVDTLIDVVGACLALERLGVREVLATPPLTGEGRVSCAHGDMPVPTPAVVELLRGRPMVFGGGAGERLTPTGAALLAELTPGFEPAGAFKAAAIGYGAGRRDPSEGPPNLVRVQLGEAAPGGRARAVAWQLEVNLDDMSAEEIGHAVGALRAAGALEVWTAPVFMKKDRPGTLVTALAREEARDDLERVLFEHTTTLGVRWSARERTECARREVLVEVAGHPIRVKVRERPPYPGASPFGARDLAPEHDDVARAAAATGGTLREVRALAVERALSDLT